MSGIFEKMTSMCEDFQLSTRAIKNSINEAKSICVAVEQRIASEQRQAAAECNALESKISDCKISPAVRRLLEMQLQDAQNRAYSISKAERQMFDSLIAESIDAESRINLQLREFETVYNAACEELARMRKKVMGDQTVTLICNWRAGAERKWKDLVEQYGEPQ